ncbi:type II toxin-antitoxin system VapB family antitoxin [Streptomyces radicis]|uniref:Type II toxin-antitoxin system VapB family antitoxin n=1 Tax=Streptomyces radicis TaxID=1750517 RepID=A0A3A9WJL1_9ACTN|nr:type II toxin-antitoxin system VapB family antitoxin [Streptomyces radicis]RKN06287.1 type II toxin-antitoxin system VapB family antitoxin [Streptomyces radicis]RKN18617.1 type II toxin-antitoxin system VapB family antitoxin [Streptomyces radicis]
MSRTIIDLDDEIVAEAMRLYGTRTKAAAVRAAMEDAVKRRLRREFADAVKSGELDFSEIIENTGPAGTRSRDGESGAA